LFVDYVCEIVFQLNHQLYVKINSCRREVRREEPIWHFVHKMVMCRNFKFGITKRIRKSFSINNSFHGYLTTSSEIEKIKKNIDQCHLKLYL